MLKQYILAWPMMMAVVVITLIAEVPMVNGQVPQLVPVTPKPGGMAAPYGYGTNGPLYHTAGLGTVQIPNSTWQPPPAPVGGIPVQNGMSPGYPGGVYVPPNYYVAQLPQQVPGGQQVYSGQQVYAPQNYVQPAAQPYPVWNPYQYGQNTASQTLWTAQVNALYMTRKDSNSFPLLIDGGGATLVDANQLDFGWQWGLDFGLSRKLGAYQNFELRYFQIDGWSALFTAPFNNGDAIATNPPTTIFANGMVDYTWESSVYSFEMNLVNRLPASDRVRLSAGFRYMEVSENLLQAFNPAGTAMIIDTNNFLYGFQLGADGVVVNSPGFGVVSWIKAGIYANSADQSTDFTGGPVISNGIRGTSAAFVGELGLMGDLQITQCLSLIGGYQMLVVSGAALAADQLPNMGPGLGGFVPTVLDQSDVFYHGAIFGLDMRF